MPWWMLLLNCSMAFAFNLATMLFISRMSALHYMVAAYSKVSNDVSYKDLAS